MGLSYCCLFGKLAWTHQILGRCDRNYVPQKFVCCAHRKTFTRRHRSKLRRRLRQRLAGPPPSSHRFSCFPRRCIDKCIILTIANQDFDTHASDPKTCPHELARDLLTTRAGALGTRARFLHMLVMACLQVRLTGSICIIQDHSCAGRGVTDPISGKAVLGRLLLVVN